MENLKVICDIIQYRLSRNKLPVLNADMSIDYALKIPASNSFTLNMNEPDIEWIISASSSSAIASGMSSARSQKSLLAEITNGYEHAGPNSLHRIVNISESKISASSFKRISSASKRLPWEDVGIENVALVGAAPMSTPQSRKIFPGRELAPLPLRSLRLTDDEENTSLVNSSISFKHIYEKN
jgi:hypothetical protein